MRKFVIWLVIIAVAAVAAFAAFWWYELRWRPDSVDEHQQEIAGLLENAGWVSPGNQGPVLYMVAHRDCAECARLMTEEFPALHEAGVDTRVIEIARRDVNALAQSTPAERATVAELWLNRSWALVQRWHATPPGDWTARGIAPADGDAARMAVVNAGREMVDELAPLLKDNGIDFGYPTLIWWNAQGEMRGCVCQEPRAFDNVREELEAAARGRATS